ncbi:MAG: DUF2141 domain-containing protein [Chlorobiaceae bacterium]|nr:DUF2141 domain-containing protein [Chlorobiaceae bacterium]
MMKTLVLLSMMLAVSLAVLHADEREFPAGRIKLTLSGVRSGNGEIRIALFNSKTGFPGKTELAFSRAVVSAEGETSVHLLEPVPYGTYAVAVFQDENRNGKLDTNFLGIPKEGVGASNNPKPKFGPPSFEDAKFVVDRPEIALDIRIR